MKNRKYIVCYLVILLIASIPLLNNYLIRGHDIYFHLMRIEGLAQGMKTGDFPVRIQPAWYGGYGYAVSVFYSDLFLYPVALLRLAGVSLQDSYKVYVVLCNLATVFISGYSFGRIFHKREIGLLGSCLYTLAPYRLVNLYTRGALGEYTGMIFWPLLIYSCVLLLNEDREIGQLKKGAIYMGVSMAGMLQSHMLTAEIACMVLVLLAVFYCRRVFHKEVILAGCVAVIIALGLSAWFLVPFLDYMVFGQYNINSIRNNDIMIQRQGTFLSQVFAIFDNAVGQSLDFSVGKAGDFTQGVGMVFMLAFLCGFIMLFRGIWSDVSRRTQRIAITSCCMGALMVWMSTLYFPWDYLCRLCRIFRYIIVKIQFPWRFTGVAIGIITLLWCVLISTIEEKEEKRETIIVVAAIALVLALSVGHFMMDLFQRGERIQVHSVEDMDSYVASGEEYLPVNTILVELKTQKLRQDEGIEITDKVVNGTRINMHVNNSSEQAGVIELPLLYYTGYYAIGRTSDRQRVHIETIDGTNHAVGIIIPATTECDIKLLFREPWYWRLAEFSTVVSLILLIMYMHGSKMDRRK